MNAMDMLPVDLLPMAWQGITGNHHALLRVVPTADLNTTLALAIGRIVGMYFITISKSKALAVGFTNYSARLLVRCSLRPTSC